jgi:hypothetical protein
MAISESALEDAFLADLFQGARTVTRARANHRPAGYLAKGW